MAFEAEFYTMFPHTVEIAPFTGIDKWRKSTFGTKVPFPCRIIGRLLELRRTEREEATQIFDIYVHAPNNVITARDQVTLPNLPMFGEDRDAPIFQVVVVTDEDGYHHHKVQTGWMYHRQTA